MLTLALTWPLVRGLARDVPADLGDSLLNMWVLAWDARHLARALAGHLDAVREYWHAAIYYPHPLALAYSEHLTAEALQFLPVYLATGNAVLAYNLLFLSTFVLSGLGMFLFVRELTGARAAAFLAGLAFAFAPYRFSALPHVQVLASMWMPFALYGFRRFFDTARLAPLAVGGAAWLAQNLSNGYYLLFFSPVVALYVVWELTVRRRWRDRRTCLRLGITALLVGAATLPFLLPYLALRRLDFPPRSIGETNRFSADVYSYLTAETNLRLWGGIMRAWPKAEGTLFPGLTAAALAAVAVIDRWRAARRAARGAGDAIRWRRARQALSWLVVGSSVLLVAMLLGWSLRLDLGRTAVKVTSLRRVLAVVAFSAAALLAVSRRARATGRGWLASPAGALTLLTLFGAAMSLGPELRAHGRLLDDWTLYRMFYRYVPGFDGLRAPARFGMIVALGVAALAGLGAHILGRWRRGPLIVALASVLILAESLAVPLDVNANSTDYKQPGLAPLPARLAIGAATPQVYGFVARLPPSAAVLEMPFGEPAFEMRYMFYAIAHRHPLVNGYSGGAPTEYGLLAEMMKDALSDPDRAWQALTRSQARFVVVHEGSYAGNRGARISAWLRAGGAREVAAFGTDRVFELPSPGRSF